MLGRPRGKFGMVGAVVAAVAVMAGVIFVILKSNYPSVNNNTANTNTDRSRYAALYDAAWRQDSGQDATLVTATLFVPPTITALGADTDRSTTEEQIWNIVRSADASTIPIILTFDSVAGSLADDRIKSSLSLQSDRNETLTVKDWIPVIAPSRVVNTTGSVSSQIGVALFSAPQAIDWPTIGTLKLTVTGIGGGPARVFTWTEPKVLLDL